MLSAVCYTLCMKAFLLISLAAFFPAFAAAQPAIEFESERHDFGQVVRGVQLEHSFGFTNKGTDELVIIGLDSS